MSDVNKLNDEVVNRGLAEFMGRNLKSYDVSNGLIYFEVNPMRGIFHDKAYTESLDALVPVWEKLNTAPNFAKNTYTNLFMCEIEPYCVQTEYKFKTIQKAAAYATYKACVELGLIKE